jgi:hypothetical protein
MCWGCCLRSLARHVCGSVLPQAQAGAPTGHPRMRRAAWAQACVLPHGEAHAPGQVSGRGRGGRQRALPAHLRSLPGAGGCPLRTLLAAARRTCAQNPQRMAVCAAEKGGCVALWQWAQGSAARAIGVVAALCTYYSMHCAICESRACAWPARCWATRSCGSAMTRAARRRWTSTSWRCGLLPVHSGYRVR